MKRFSAVLALAIVLIVALLVGALFFILGGNFSDKTASTQDKKDQDLQTPTAIKTVIIAKAGNTEIVISPSNERVVKGIITITATKVPNETKLVAFAIQGGNIDPIEKTGPNIGVDNDGDDGWSYLLDTKKYENDLYSISAIAGKSVGSEPLGAVTAQVIIQN